jgi:molybdopterin-guanine dinucleotide biosynthesis protein A
MTMDNRVVWRGDEVIKATSRDAERALFRGAEFVLAKANETVPYLEGILAASGHVSVSGLVATVSYDTPYAVKQHEDITLRHSGKRRAQWLRLTLQEQMYRILQLMADQLKRSFE